jgi:RES domain-containing protein
VIYDPQVLDVLEGLESNSWQGSVFRHMLGSWPPDKENSRGARWNPPEIRAIYTSLQRETAIAEGDYALNVQPVASPIKRTIYTIEVSLSSVLQLIDWVLLEKLGLNAANFGADDYAVCQHLGGAVEWLKHDGLIIPSARAKSGKNLVIFPNRQKSGYRFEPVGVEELPSSQPG